MSERELERSTETARRRAEELEDSLTDLSQAEIQTAKDLSQMGVKYGRRRTDRNGA